MNNTKKFTALNLLFLALSQVGCSHGIKAMRVSNASPDNRYVVYALPKNVITITVPFKKTEVSKPECTLARLLTELQPPPATEAPVAAVAAPFKRKGPVPPAADPPASPTEEEKKQKLEKLQNELKLRLSLAGINHDNKTYTPRSNIEVGTVTTSLRAEPDEKQIFAISLDSDFLSNTKMGFELNDAGFMSSASIESTSVVYDVAVKTLQAAVSVGGAIAAYGGKSNTKKAGHCSAVLAALEEVRKDKTTLLSAQSGQVNGSPKEAVDYLLAELKAYESSLVQEFTGFKKVSEASAVCEVTPAVGIASYNLLSFSSGGLSVSTGVDCVVPKDWKLESALQDAQPLSVELEISDQLATETAKVNPEPKVGGIFYRTPARVTVKVVSGDAKNKIEHHRTRFDIAQLGRVAVLPGAEVSAATVNFVVKLSPTTGALTSYSSTLNAPNPALIDSVAAAAKGAVDTAKERKKKEEGKEVEELEREKKRLELIRDIEKLKQEQPAQK